MNRRHFLVRSAAAGSVFLAGCTEDPDSAGLDDDSDPESGGTDAGDDADEGTTGRTPADEHIMRAVSSLNTAALSLEVVEERVETPDDAEFDAEEPRQRVHEAADHLDDAAGAEGADDRRTDIEALGRYADVLERMVDVTETIVETDFGEAAASIRTAIDDGRLEDARTAIDERREPTEASLDRIRPAVETLDELDWERLEAMDTAEIAPIDAGVRQLVAVLESLATVADGYETIVEGYEAVEEGRERFEGREYDGAETAFLTARDRFDEAAGTFAAGRDDAVEGLGEQFDDADCQARRFREGVELLAESAAAAADGDRERADDRREDGEGRLESGTDC